jgi:hypothetical protein
MSLDQNTTDNCGQQRTRTTYTYEQLIALAASPLAQAVPVGMPHIPGVTGVMHLSANSGSSWSCTRLNDVVVDGMLAYIYAKRRDRSQHTGISAYL